MGAFPKSPEHMKYEFKCINLFERTPKPFRALDYLSSVPKGQCFKQRPFHGPSASGYPGQPWRHSRALPSQ